MESAERGSATRNRIGTPFEGSRSQATGLSCPWLICILPSVVSSVGLSQER